MRRKKTARKAPRRAAKKSTRRKRSSSKKLSRVSVISDILSSEYGVSSEPEPAPKKKSSKKKSYKKKSSKKKSSKKKVAKKGATPKKSGKMTYKDFVKEEFPKVQAEMPKGTPFITITKEVANRWRKYKEVFV